MSDDALLSSLLAAVAAAPDDVPLRLHVAGQLADRGRVPEALTHCSEALQRAPGDAKALALLQRLTAELSGPPRRPEQAGFDWSRAEDEPIRWNVVAGFALIALGAMLVYGPWTRAT